MRALPALLIALRGTLGAVLLALGLSGHTGWPFALLLIAGLLSDIFDGVLARRLGVASARLRLADSVTDGIFVLCVGGGLLSAFWPEVRPLTLLLAVYLLTDGLGWAFDLHKFGRLAAYHAYTTKLTGLLLCVAALRLTLTAQVDWLAAALVVGSLNHLERLCMSALLLRWTPDVPTLWHAWKLRAAF